MATDNLTTTPSSAWTDLGHLLALAENTVYDPQSGTHQPICGDEQLGAAICRLGSLMFGLSLCVQSLGRFGASTDHREPAPPGLFDVFEMLGSLGLVIGSAMETLEGAQDARRDGRYRFEENAA